MIFQNSHSFNQLLFLFRGRLLYGGALAVRRRTLDAWPLNGRWLTPCLNVDLPQEDPRLNNAENFSAGVAYLFDVGAFELLLVLRVVIDDCESELFDCRLVSGLDV